MKNAFKPVNVCTVFIDVEPYFSPIVGILIRRAKYFK